MKISILKLPATLILITTLGACASSGERASTLALRDATLQRWSSCVDRQISDDSLPDAMFRIEQYCEGHKRDLIAAYPPHLESQLESTLIAKTNQRAVELLAEEAAKQDETTISVTLK